jgi:hypothetical protein
VTALRPVSTAQTEDEEREALAARIADPLWLLGRQWQTGGFIADDAGTPTSVRLAHVTVPLLRGGAPLTSPIEPSVEAERAPRAAELDTALSARLAAELVRRLRDAGVEEDPLRTIREALSAAHPLLPEAGSPAMTPFAGRLPNGAALFARLAAVLAPDGSGGPFPALPGVDSAHAATVETAARGWFAWAHPQLSAGDAADIAPAAWDAERLEYSFALTAELPSGDVGLHADGYDGSGVDWYTFDRTQAPATPAPSPAAVAVRPSPVTYAGMPRPRYWELEDGHVNLDAMAGTDPAHVLLAQFAHAFANDWFLVPLEVPPGVCLITTLEVTDTFGTTTSVPATASVDGSASRWRLWELAGETGDAGAALRLFPPPSAAPLQGPELEDVLIARDEMANLAWVIELTTRDRDGDAVDRQRRWLRLRPPDDPAFDPAHQAEVANYRLGTQLPDNWYPLVAAGDHRLALAEVPPEAAGVSDAGVQGRLVPHVAGTLIADEEASRSGIRVRRVDRLLRTPAGRAVWRARTKQPGTGEASSGLRFDVLR